jgi:pyrroloquinoline quinone biosynthesis protein B
MVVQVLGSAAGGGLPQWNCGCSQCSASRNGKIERRTQCSVAVSADRQRWILVNASPDLRSQLLSFPIQPSLARRETPIEAVLLTDADLDHVLGLFLLRENGREISVHASKPIRSAIEEGLHLTEILAGYCGIRWVEVPFEFSPLLYHDGSESGMEYRAIEIQGQSPRYQQGMTSPVPGCPRLAYIFRERGKSNSVLIAPGVARLEPLLLTELNQAEAVFFDGTCWSRNDFGQSGVTKTLATELWQSHLPISEGSLAALAQSRARQKVYLHINNTNPILWSHSRERKQLDESGIKVAADGMEFEL